MFNNRQGYSFKLVEFRNSELYICSDFLWLCFTPLFPVFWEGFLYNIYQSTVHKLMQQSLFSVYQESYATNYGVFTSSDGTTLCLLHTLVYLSFSFERGTSVKLLIFPKLINNRYSQASKHTKYKLLEEIDAIYTYTAHSFRK